MFDNPKFSLVQRNEGERTEDQGAAENTESGPGPPARSRLCLGRHLLAAFTARYLHPVLAKLLGSGRGHFYLNTWLNKWLWLNYLLNGLNWRLNNLLNRMNWMLYWSGGRSQVGILWMLKVGILWLPTSFWSSAGILRRLNDKGKFIGHFLSVFHQLKVKCARLLVSCLDEMKDEL